MKRHLYLSYREAREAVKDKERFEALCFAMLIKAGFANSCLYKRTFRELKGFFHIGLDKLRRATKNAKKWGYIREYGDGRMVAIGLKDVGRKNIIIPVESFYKGTKRGEEKSTITIRQVEHSIRKQLLLAHIEKVNFYGNITKTIASRDKSNGKIDKNKYKKAKKIATRTVNPANGLNLYEQICNGDVSESRVGVSKKSLSKVISCSSFTVWKLINELHQSGDITNIIHRIEDTPYHKSQLHELNRLNDPRASKGYYRTYGGKDTLVLQCSNIYTLKKDTKNVVRY